MSESALTAQQLHALMAAYEPLQDLNLRGCD